MTSAKKSRFVTRLKKILFYASTVIAFKSSLKEEELFFIKKYFLWTICVTSSNYPNNWKVLKRNCSRDQNYFFEPNLTPFLSFPFLLFFFIIFFVEQLLLLSDTQSSLITHPEKYLQLSISN